MKVVGAGLRRLVDLCHCDVDIDVDNIIDDPDGTVEFNVDVFFWLVSGKIVGPVAAGFFELFGSGLPSGMLMLRGPEGRKGGPEGLGWHRRQGERGNDGSRRLREGGNS